MPVYELTPYRDADLTFSRGETPAFRIEFTDLTAEQFAACTFTADVRRAPTLAPIAFWTPVVDPATTSVTFSLTSAASDTLPDQAVYQVRIAYQSSVRVPMGGRLILRLRSCE